MPKSLLLVLCISLSTILFSQDWELTQLADMPEAVSNNSVISATVNGKQYVYSFAGIDSTKIFSGIHNKCWRYDVDADSWSALPDLPDPMGKIALGVSIIGDIAYIIGGYHVFANGSELTSEKVHRFDLTTNTFLSDAAPTPVPVDDHIQIVYKDSLIYLVTGWSGDQTAGTNVPDVQIFDPANNSWQVGTPVPNTPSYKVFGGSGVLIDDKIYYFGGAKINGFNFNSSTDLRIGTIDPTDPAQITWSFETTPFFGYRTAAAVVDGSAYFIGGSNVTYNFNGIAYNGTGGVSPNRKSLLYDPVQDTVILRGPFDDLPMDLRSLAEISNEQKIIAGGMEAGQKVSKKTWLLNFIPVDYVATKNFTDLPLVDIIPNPSSNFIRVKIETNPSDSYQIYNQLGQLVASGNFDNTEINIGRLAIGRFVLTILREDQTLYRGKFSKI